jgi:hypothetical protein
MARTQRNPRSTTRSEPHPERPYGSLVGLFMACLVTLLGVWRGLDPDTILVRASMAATIVGIATSAVSRTISFLVAR